MTPSPRRSSTAGIVLVGTYPWNYPAFEALIPRALLPVAHRPLMSYAIAWLQSVGIDQIGVCGNRDTSAIRTSVLWPMAIAPSVTYVQDHMPRGAAGSARDAAQALDADMFVVVEGTSIPRVPLEPVLDAHHASGAAATIVVHRETGAAGVPLDVATGIYVFTREAFDRVPAAGFFDIKENFIPELYRTGARVAAHHTAHASARVLSPDTYLAVNDWQIQCRAAQLHNDPRWISVGGGVAHREASIAGSAVILGPVLIGPGARIDPGAMIIGPSSIGSDVIVEAGAVVARSAVWRRGHVGARAVADRAILADGAHLAARARAYRLVMPSAVTGAAARHIGHEDPARPLHAAAARSTWRRFARALIEARVSESAASR